MATTAKPDALALLIRDHKEVDELFEQFEGSDDPLQGGVIGGIIEALTVHTAVEEQIVYPAMRAAFPDGEAKVGDAIADHQRVTKMLADLAELATLDPAVGPAVHALAKEVRAHVAEEESDLFPRLADALGEAKLQDMGRAIEKARATAPETPLTDRVAGAVDRVRDLLGEAAEKGRELFESRPKNQP